MKRYDIHRLQAKQVMETCNPLGVLDCNKRYHVFSSPVACYEWALNRLAQMCPSGWVDIPLYMQRMQGISLADAEGYCGFRNKAVFMWDCGNNVEARYQRFEKIKAIFMRMLKVTGCDFSEDALTKALYEYDATLSQHKYYNKEYEPQNTNIKFT